MHAVIFDLDTTVFASDMALHDDVASLLAILNRLGMKVGALTNGDHRMVVRLEEAGIRHHFDGIITTSHVAEPKHPDAVGRLLDGMRTTPHHTVLVSAVETDMSLGRQSGLAKTIRVVHGPVHKQHHTSDTDHAVEDIAAVLDVLE